MKPISRTLTVTSPAKMPIMPPAIRTSMLRCRLEEVRDEPFFGLEDAMRKIKNLKESNNSLHYNGLLEEPFVASKKLLIPFPNSKQRWSLTTDLQITTRKLLYTPRSLLLRFNVTFYKCHLNIGF